MRTRSGSAAGSASIASPPATVAARRELRPRRAAEVRGASFGAGASADAGANTNAGSRSRTGSGGTQPHAAAPRIGASLARRPAASQTTTRRRAAFTGDTDELQSPQSPTPSPRTSRTSRKRSVPQDLSAAANRRSKRSRPQSGFYDEDSDSDDGSEEDSNEAYLSPTSPGAVPSQAIARPSKPRPSPRTSARMSSQWKRRKGKFVVTTNRRRARTDTLEKSGNVDSAPQKTEHAVIPNWLALPYFILVEIFQNASASLDDREAVNWLLSTSRVCRTFAEPALTALYKCPALLSRPMAHNLVAFLSRDPTTTMFNYRAKVEKLRIDVESIAAKTFMGNHLDFSSLVVNLPRLKVLDFSHPKDLPPYRMLDDNLRWHYPPTLFRTLNGIVDDSAENGAVVVHQPSKLIGWRWNRRLMGPDLDIAQIRELHLTQAFSSLKKISFINYQVPSMKAVDDVDDPEIAARDLAFIQSIADAISVLPELEYLSIESSTIVNEHLLPLLPRILKTLELINCWDINGEHFASYLLTHGHKLEHLRLHHNQSLNLSFLTVLSTACPNLQTLCMDFKTYKHHEFYQDSDPSYDDVLTVDQVPQWPESLETIDLKNMRKWTAGAAEVFFQSLIESAPRLLKLRNLYLKAMLDIPFRQRSELRDKWEARLKRMFLCKRADPMPLVSMRSPTQKTQTPSQQEPKKAVDSVVPTRRSGRIATAYDSSPDSRASSVGRDLRRNGTGRPSYVEPDTDGEDLEVDEDDEEDNGDCEEDDEGLSPTARRQMRNKSISSEDSNAGGFCHGMCDRVEIQLDNQKPTERTWRMEDFLDDEQSDDLSDEDWNGDDDVDGGGYAW
ncbi:hypothetical protein B0T17DRAFT_16728 [Bombardia bombarda]|uniref:F-box domain-containing protein n=1 Tax=Bombardia bombarda TaxID=252184 RepID=A0AA40CDT5_9PEZI|nr:hypothetical protein B0T17DRAFT_16728 [Bombardia bombarda]